jgi:putative membrane protein
MRPGPSAKRLSRLTTPRVVVGVIALSLAAACGGSAEGAALASAAGSDEGTPTTGARILTDENILAVAGEGARAEMQLARLAANRVRHARVKHFALSLVEDHSRTDRAVKDLERKLNLTEELPASDTTAQELQHLVERFNSLTPSAFDTAFVNHVIENHAHDIGEMRSLAGRAKRPEVRELLQSSIPELRAHLSQAKALKQALRRR